jgi:hypothetical protein
MNTNSDLAPASPPWFAMFLALAIMVGAGVGALLSEQSGAANANLSGQWHGQSSQVSAPSTGQLAVLPRPAPVLTGMITEPLVDLRNRYEALRWQTDPAALRAALQILDRCRTLPSPESESTRQADDPMRQSVYKRLLAQCGGFQSRPVDEDEELALAQRAASLGDASARARLLLLGSSGNTRTPQHEQIARDLLATGDGQVIVSLLPFLMLDDSIPIGGRQMFSLTDRTLAQAALSLLACRLGANCDGESDAVLTYCLQWSACDVRSVPEMWSRHLLTPAQFGRAQEMADEMERARREHRFQAFGLH